MVLNNCCDSNDVFVQLVTTTTTALVHCTTSIPYDNTIPQNTEGDQVLTLAIIPKYSTSKLEIKFTLCGVKTAAGNVVVALFQDSTANALAAKAFASADQNACVADLFYVMTSGTTSSTTFKIRIGSTANSFDVNGVANARVFGGVADTTLTIMEYL